MWKISSCTTVCGGDGNRSQNHHKWWFIGGNISHPSLNSIGLNSSSLLNIVEWYHMQMKDIRPYSSSFLKNNHVAGHKLLPRITGSKVPQKVHIRRGGNEWTFPQQKRSQRPFFRYHGLEIPLGTLHAGRGTEWGCQMRAKEWRAKNRVVCVSNWEALFHTSKIRCLELIQNKKVDQLEAEKKDDIFPIWESPCNVSSPFQHLTVPERGGCVRWWLRHEIWRNAWGVCVKPWSSGAPRCVQKRRGYVERMVGSWTDSMSKIFPNAVRQLGRWVASETNHTDGTSVELLPTQVLLRQIAKDYALDMLMIMWPSTGSRSGWREGSQRVNFS